MRMPPLLADFSHAKACKPFCEKSLTLPSRIAAFLLSPGDLTVTPYLLSFHISHAFLYGPIHFPPFGFINQAVCQQGAVKVMQPDRFCLLAFVSFHPAQPPSVCRGSPFLCIIVCNRRRFIRYGARSRGGNVKKGPCKNDVVSQKKTNVYLIFVQNHLCKLFCCPI